jgi:predicted nucleotidyltransferase
MEDEKLFLALKEIGKTLKGLNWIIFSGFAVKIYAQPDRAVNDIDIVIPKWEEFLEASKRFKKEIKKRLFEKENNSTFSDHGFKTTVRGVEVEITAGDWIMKFEGFISKPNLDEDWTQHASEKEFLGLKLKLQPLEDLIVQKIAMNREKDKKDLEYLLTKLKEVDMNFLKKDAENWNCLEKVVSILKI